VNRWLRAAWLATASVIAGAGLAFGLGIHRDAERVVDATAAALFVCVLAVLAGVGYGLHRVVAKAPPHEARRQAALDAVVAAVAGPSLLFAIVLATTIEECSFGTGC
jgi:hypothetical protein